MKKLYLILLCANPLCASAAQAKPSAIAASTGGSTLASVVVPGQVSKQEFDSLKLAVNTFQQQHQNDQQQIQYLLAQVAVLQTQQARIADLEIISRAHSEIMYTHGQQLKHLAIQQAQQTTSRAAANNTAVAGTYASSSAPRSKLKAHTPKYQRPYNPQMTALPETTPVTYYFTAAAPAAYYSPAANSPIAFIPSKNNLREHTTH